MFSLFLVSLLLAAVTIVDIVTIALYVPSLASIAIRVVIVTAIFSIHNIDGWVTGSLMAY